MGRWLAVDKFFRYMQAAAYDFEVTRSRRIIYRELYYGNLGYEGPDD